jgi:hypothetical protein
MGVPLSCWLSSTRNGPLVNANPVKVDPSGAWQEPRARARLHDVVRFQVWWELIPSCLVGCAQGSRRGPRVGTADLLGTRRQATLAYSQRRQVRVDSRGPPIGTRTLLQSCTAALLVAPKAAVAAPSSRDQAVPFRPCVLLDRCPGRRAVPAG